MGNQPTFNYVKASEAGKKYEMEDEERFGGGIDLDRAK